MLNEWIAIADEVGLEEFDIALTRHIRNSKFFPTIAELRLLAGLNEQDREAIEINSAWQFALHYATHYWHPDLGFSSDAPKISPRTSYAIRQIGGFKRLNNYQLDSLPFMRADFAAAYRLADKAMHYEIGAGELLKQLGATVKGMS